MAHTIDLTDDSVETENAALAAKPTSKAIAVAMNDYDAYGVHGEVGASDLTIPYLSIVQKSGTKADQFTPGSWVVGENKVAEKDSALQVVVLSIEKRYEEVTAFGSGIIPRVFESADEVRKAGLSLQKGASNEAREIAGILFWITAPKGTDENLFPIVCEDGTRGCIAKYVARSTGYSGVAMPIFTSISPLGHLRGKPVRAGLWELSAALTKSNGNTFYKVSLRPRGATPANVLDQLKHLSI